MILFSFNSKLDKPINFKYLYVSGLAMNVILVRELTTRKPLSFKNNNQGIITLFLDIQLTFN